MEGLSFFGLENRLVHLGAGEYLTADFYYAYNVSGPNYDCPVLLCSLRAHLLRRLNLDREKPTIHGFLERKVSRILSNLHDIFAMAKLEFPQRHWEFLQKSSSLLANAVYFNNVRLFFGAHGAGFLNLIFMQPKNVLCEVARDRMRDNYISMSWIFGMLHIVSRLANMIHHSGQPMFLPMEIAYNMLKIGMNFLDKRHEKK
jgi:hypothetical protein